MVEFELYLAPSTDEKLARIHREIIRENIIRINITEGMIHRSTSTSTTASVVRLKVMTFANDSTNQKTNKP